MVSEYQKFNFIYFYFMKLFYSVLFFIRCDFYFIWEMKNLNKITLNIEGEISK